MLIDALGMLRADGSSPRISDTEAGSISLTRDATTGKVVIEIRKTGKNGLPIVVMADPDTGTSTDKSAVVTIEAANELAFDTTQEVVATFPAVTYADLTEKFMVRRVHTAKKYLRSVITFAGANGTLTRDFVIVIGHALMNT